MVTSFYSITLEVSELSEKQTLAFTNVCKAEVHGQVLGFIHL